MPFAQFDRSRLLLKPLAQRTHDLNLNAMMDLDACPAYSHETIDLLAQRIRAARE